MTPAETVAQIRALIQRMIEAGLSDQQNYPSTQQYSAQISEIGISGSPTLNVSMKDVPYREIYQQLDAGRAYHIKMIDGALIQLCYRFEKIR